MKKTLTAALCCALAVLTGCALYGKKEPVKINLVTLDPGHFHAYLVQKKMYPEVNPLVQVYAPEGPEVRTHLKMIESFNADAKNPTAWTEDVYIGKDYLEKMLADKKGNVVVLAGNNSRKAEYILACVKAGYNVHADKPMAITPKDFELLKEAFKIAEEKGLIVRDIMTERYEISTMLQTELAKYPELYGEQDKGSPESPAITKESVHHFCKTVSGKTLVRPPWFYDVKQQGEAIVDVTTHLTDLIQGALYPQAALTPDDVKVLSARTWNTPITAEQFKKSTGLDAYPDYLKSVADANNVLQVAANGEFTYTLKGVHAKVSVLWNFEAPAGTGDTHYSLMRGTKASLIIRQGKDEGYKPMVYIEPAPGVNRVEAEEALRDALKQINKKWPGVLYRPAKNGWALVIADKYAVGHEAHFIEVTEHYIKYLQDGKMPKWETDFMITKYHTLMEAYKLSRK